MNDAPHIPVLCSEVLEALAPQAGQVFVDGTFGAGGYTRAILEAADCSVIAVDRDPSAIMAGRALEAEYRGRLTLIHGRFGDLVDLLSSVGVREVDGVTFDVGVSSMHLDQPARGFSFREDGPLDARMSQEGVSAADLVNGMEERDLARVIAVYGEERRARAIARAIVARRAEKPFLRTVDLASVVASVAGGKGYQKIHPATRTFQALRIAVNDELGELARGLGAAERALREGGRLAVVAFHSLESRIVKRFLAERSEAGPRGSRHLPEVGGEGPEPSFELLFRGARKPREDEIARNPRARSAQLRAARRTAAPAWPLDLSSLGVPDVSLPPLAQGS